MMSQHLTSMFEQIGNFTKNNLTPNNKHVKEKDNKSNSNHVGVEKQQASPSHKLGHTQPPPPLKKPYKLRNVCSKAESYDTLYANSIMVSAFHIFLQYSVLIEVISTSKENINFTGTEYPYFLLKETNCNDLSQTGLSSTINNQSYLVSTYQFKFCVTHLFTLRSRKNN